ncbi:MAG: GntR family transcriptional regulator [Acidobacteriaceae bacterium]|nr:GntR family transcriptional regulator [Acidobacteriaceae bacterium]
MTLFRLQLGSGQSIFEQVVFAAKKAFISGEFQPGQPFPSVRSMATELKIHPNTAHKVIQHLIQEGYLKVHPGIGTIVAEIPEPRPAEKKRLLREEIERLVVEAKRLGLELQQVTQAVEAHWARLDRSMEVLHK